MMPIEGSAARVEPYDFRLPGRVTGHVDRVLRGWLTRAGLLLADRFDDFWSFDVHWEPGALDARRVIDLADQPAVVGCLLRISPQHDPSLLSFPRPAALALVGGILGEPVEQLPADRPLTTLEAALFDALARRVVDGLNEVRPPDVKPFWQFDAVLDEPNIVAIYPHTPDLAAMGLSVQGPFGRVDCHWYWTDSLVQELLGTPAELEAPPTPNTGEMETVARAIPLELVVRLGSATLSVGELARLRPGDCIVLDQRVDEPLVASVNGQPMFSGWPGRMGRHQAYQVYRAEGTR